ncbi:MAG TPA: alpha/beta hydrolase-fold protein, partial [Acidimicrobiales bacterium]|nr:alpha/beta hydrolase-fold protein [Acidimicrobiales bacterium]
MPPLVIALAVATLVLSIGWRRHTWVSQLGIGVPVTAVLLGAAFGLVTWLSLLPRDYPKSLLAWIALFFGAIVVACIGWPRAPWWRRAVSALSVLATLAAALTALNKTYQYYPTVAALFGKNAANQVGIPELDHLRSEVRSTGRLPDAGVTVTMHVPNKASGFAARDAYVWLPPAWFATPQPRLPAIILLHGTPGSPSDWTRAGFADQTANAFAKQHGGKAPIVVMPDPNGSFTADTECVDSDMGKAETYLTKDVPAFLQGRLRAATGPRSLAIAGL